MKRIILFLAVLFTVNITAQTRTLGTQLKVKTLPTAAGTDNVLAADSDGLLKRTNVLVSALGSGGGTPTLQAVVAQGATTSNGITITDTGEALRFQTTAGDDKFITFDGGGDDFRIDHSTFNAGLGLESQLILNAAPRATGVYAPLVTFTRTGSVFNKAVSVIATNNQLGLQGTNTVTFNVDASITANRTLTFPNASGRLALATEITSWSTVTGTLAEDNLDVVIGAPTGQGQGTNLRVSDEQEQVIVNANSGLIVNGSVNFGAGTNKASLTFSGATQGRGFSFPDKAGTVALLDDIKAKEIDTSTAQTNSTLNTAFPSANNPVGTIVVNTNSAQPAMYIRVSTTNWVSFSGTAL